MGYNRWILLIVILVHETDQVTANATGVDKPRIP
ncbi:hypothetical protein BH11PLA2_BH11PLA2_32920 [soil metagenome]